MVDLKDTKALDLEFRQVWRNFEQYHNDMIFYLDAYQNNLFYPPKDYQPYKKKIGVNFLQVFADKMCDYMTPFPKITVPAVPEDKQGASLREKVLIGEWQQNDGEQLWARGIQDAVLMSVLVTSTEWDFDNKCNVIKRIDPRRAMWQKADAMSDKISATWYYEPMTKEAIYDKYKVTPNSTALTIDLIADLDSVILDGHDYFLVVTRADDKTFVKWVGDKFLVAGHNHKLGASPIDISFPLEIPSYNKRGDFYLRRLSALQAEFNELWRQRANVVRKLGNPTVWGRNIKQRQFQPVKDAMALDGGFVGLSETGELGILSLPETKMIDNAIADTFTRMKEVAGFPTITFGEAIGANTSGGALSFYFQPTARMIAKMNVALKVHIQTINTKILRNYDNFLAAGEQKELYTSVTGGYYPTDRGTDPDSERSLTFTKDDIDGDYNNKIDMTPVAPRDEVAYARLFFDAAREKMISRTTLYDKLGLESPEDELAMLKEEQLEPALNPQGTSQILGAQADAQTALMGQ